MATLFDHWNAGKIGNFGGFQTALFEAYRRADNENRKPLKAGWPFWFVEEAPEPAPIPPPPPRDVETVVTEGTLAYAFKQEYGKRLIFNCQDYKWSAGPGTWDKPAVKRASLCQYQITFTDGSTIRVIMTNAQYNGLNRGKFAGPTSIGGEGYRQPK